MKPCSKLYVITHSFLFRSRIRQIRLVTPLHTANTHRLILRGKIKNTNVAEIQLNLNLNNKTHRWRYLGTGIAQNGAESFLGPLKGPYFKKTVCRQTSENTLRI